MARTKRDVIKLLTVAIAICLSIFAFVLPKEQAKAEVSSTVAVFSLTKGASIRLPNGVDEIVNGEEKAYKGLRFSTQVNDLWFESNQASEYVFGTLIFPEKNGSVNTNWSEYDNVKELEAVRIVADTEDVKANGYYTAAIVYDHSMVKKLAISAGYIEEDDPEIEEKTQMLLDGLYSMRLTAVSYVKKDGVITYTDSYTTSITEVAVRLLTNPDWVDRVSEYVALEEIVKDGYVLVEDGKLGNFVATDVKQVLLNGENVDYQIDGETIILPSLISSQTGQEYKITVLDYSNNAVIVNAVTADVSISTAEEFIAIFDAGDYSASNTYPIKNSKYYVLAEDLNLENYIIDNTADAGTIVLSGTLNGLGHTVENAIVDMTKSGGKATQGIFGSITGTIKNVGFVNLKGTASSGVDVGLTAPLAKDLSGTLENVYVGVSASNYNRRGPISTYGATAKLTNVVIDFPQASGFVFDDAMYQTVAMSTSTYAYGYGALGYSIGSLNSNNLENVYVISPMPVNYAFGAGGSSFYDSTSLTTDYFFYGENETDVWFNYSYFASQGITNPTVANTKGKLGSSKTVVLDGIRRYNTLSDMANDVSSENLANVQKFLALDGWKEGANGELLWKDQKQTFTINNAVDYDASTGTLHATTMPDASLVTSVEVDGNVLTIGNGLSIDDTDGSLVINALSKGSADTNGVLYRDSYSHSTNVFNLTIYAQDGTYIYNNVEYQTRIITTPEELKLAIDVTYTGDNIHNNGFYKLGNDLLIPTGYAFTRTKGSVANQNTDAGFNGIFDGCGHTIDFNGVGLGQFGMFHGFNHTASPQPAIVIEVKNFAAINYGSNGSPLLGLYPINHTYSRGMVIENIYVSYAENTVPGGLIYMPSSGKTTYSNILVDSSNNTNMKYSTNVAYGSDIVGKAFDHTSGIWKAYEYGAGSLFGTLRWGSQAVSDSVTNVISLGLTPIVQSKNAYPLTRARMVTTTGSAAPYTHAIKTTTGYSAGMTYEVYYGYAGNQEYGDIAIPTGVKPGFLEIASTTNADVLAGYYCPSCYEEFSLQSSTCGTCGVSMYKSSNLWATPQSYIWTRTATAGLNAKFSQSNHGELVFDYVNKYDTDQDMQDAYKKDSTIYDSFLGEDGNGLWSVNSSGKLVWKNSVNKDVVVKVNNEVSSGSVNVKAGETVSVEVYNGTEPIEITSMTASSDVISVIGTSGALASKFGTATLTFTYSVGGVTLTESIEITVSHDYGKLIGGTAPTCTENGTIDHYKCSCCDKYFDRNFNEISSIEIIASHDYGAWVSGGDGSHYKVCKNDNTHVIMEICSGSEATCTEDGICSTCNGVYEEALGHEGGEPTCDEWGACTRCGEDYIKPTGHDYSKVVISDDYLVSGANCLDKAVYYYACANCGGVDGNYTFEYGEALGHEGGEANCTNLAICSRCGVPYGDVADHVYEYKFDENYHWEECVGCQKVINKTAHELDGGVKTKDPTCVEYGETTYSCTCGYKEYEDIAMLPHNLGAFNDEVSSTCEQNGVKAHYQCTSCLQYFDEDEDLIKDINLPKAHVFRKYNQPIAPTCTVAGRIGFYHCEVCGKFFEFDQVTELQESQLEVPQTGHDENTDYSTGRCPCGDVYADDEFFLQYFEFINVGHRLPENKNGAYTWGYKLNRFYGDLPGAPVHIKIPTTYNGQPVYSIGDYVFDTSDRDETCVPGSGNHKNCETGSCSYLKYYREDPVIDEETEEIIGYRDTSPTDGNPNAVAIQSIVIPEGIRMIGTAAFVGSELRELVIPNSVVGGNGTDKKSVVPEGAVYNRDIYDYSLKNICGGCNLLEKVVIGSGVEVIGGYCFYGLKSLRDVKFVVEEVDNGNGTTSLKGVREIQPRAFGSADVTVDPTQPDLSAPKFIIPKTLVSLPEGSIYDNNTAKNVRLYRLHSTDMKYYLDITEEEYNDLLIPAKERDEFGNFVNEEDKKLTTYGYTEGWCATSILYFKGEWYIDETTGNPIAYEEIESVDVAYDGYNDTYKYLNNGTIVGLTDSGKLLDTLTVPTAINGIEITKIAPNAFKYSNATSVILSESIIEIDSYAFRRMYNLKSVVATSNLTRVGKDLFRDSKQVNSVILISNNASVSNIVISGTNRIALMSEKVGAFTISISGNNYLFTTSETTYTLDSNGFMYNTENVLAGYFGTQKEVTIYDNIVEIGDNAFENSGVNKVNLPEGLKKIGNNAFRNSNITSIDVPAGVTYIGEGAFAYTNIKEFTLPAGVETISANTFAGCKLLREFNLNDILTEIGDGAFSGCVKLQEMILPSTVTRIGESAFLGAEMLSKVFIPKSIEIIDAYAFTNCNDLTWFEYEGTRADWNLVDIDRNWIFATEEFDVIFANGVGGYLDIQGEMNLLINETGKIAHNLNGILFWEIDNEAVATVDQNGVVTAIDVGQAIVKVKMGRDYGKCVINVGYGDQLPELVIENGIQDGDLLEIGNTYNLYPYVTFNFKEFSDFTLTCSSSNRSVATVTYNQNSQALVLKSLSTGKATITVNAKWREFNSNDVYTLTQTFSFDVIGDVDFFVNGDLPYTMSVLAPNEYSNEGDNIASLVPTVVIDGVTYTPSVSLDYLGNASAEHLIYDSENSRIVGYKVSSAKVMLRYVHNGIEMGTDFYIHVLPNDVTLEGTYLFSADDGMLMIENESGVYEPVTIATLLNDTVNTARSDGFELFVDGDGTIKGVNYKPTTYNFTTIEVISDCSRYVIPVQIAKRYLDTADDFLEVLNLANNVADDGSTIEGSFALVADINMNRKTAYNFVNGNGADTRGVDYFNGMFDGRGHTISNLTINMYLSGCNNQGIFGTISENSVIKDIAFVNFIGRSTSDVGLTSPFAHNLYGKLENVYIEIAKATCNYRGAINQIRSGAELNNVVISFKVGDAFDYATVSQDVSWKSAWGYGSLAQGVSSTAVYNNVYVVSSLPLYYNTAGGGATRYDMESLTSDYFLYGENETEFWFEHTVNAGKTFDEVVVDFTSGTASKAMRISGVRRYDTLSDIVSDASAENVEKLNQLLSTGYWTTEDGSLIWN